LFSDEVGEADCKVVECEVHLQELEILVGEAIHRAEGERLALLSVLAEKVDAVLGLGQSEGEPCVVLEALDGALVAGLEENRGVLGGLEIVFVLELPQWKSYCGIDVGIGVNLHVHMPDRRGGWDLVGKNDCC